MNASGSILHPAIHSALSMVMASRTVTYISHLGDV